MRNFYYIQEYIKKGIRIFSQFLTEKEKCICCKKDCYNIPLCKDCKQRLLNFAKASMQRCKICGKVLISESEICTKCRNIEQTQYCDIMFPIFSYTGWKKNLVLRWKIDDCRSLSDFFADCIEQVICKNGWQTIPIIPVPPRKNKIQEKGWDQIDELVNILGKKYDHKVLKVLKRNNSIEQKKLSIKERYSTNAKAYSLKNKNIFHIKTERISDSVILIDDVKTTGTTLQTCARILKENGIKKVYAITLFCVD